MFPALKGYVTAITAAAVVTDGGDAAAAAADDDWKVMRWTRQLLL